MTHSLRVALKSRGIQAALLALLANLAALSPAYALLGVASDAINLQKMCDGSSPRSTTIYVDSRAVSSDNLQWAKSLINKLRSGLAPHEKLTIVALDTVNANISEIDSFCYPVLWPNEPRQAGGWFSKSTESLVEEGRKVFRRVLAVALDKAIKKYPADADVDKVNLIRTLSSDTARFAREDGVKRLIIYSDFAEQSDLANMAGDSEMLDGNVAARKAGTEFHDAVVYGIEATADFSPGRKASVNNFFKQFFRAANAYPVDISTNISLPSDPPLGPKLKLSVKGSWQGRELRGHAYILSNDEGRLQDSYISFADQGGAILNGSVSCDDGECKVEAETANATLTSNAGEKLELSGEPTALEGFIGWPGYKTSGGEKAVIELAAEGRHLGGTKSDE